MNAHWRGVCAGGVMERGVICFPRASRDQPLLLPPLGDAPELRNAHWRGMCAWGLMERVLICLPGASSDNLLLLPALGDARELRNADCALKLAAYGRRTPARLWRGKVGSFDRRTGAIGANGHRRR